MNFEILNVLILSIGGLISLWETFLLAMGKKILKGSSEIVGIANLGVLIYGLNNFLHNSSYRILASFAVVLAFLIIRYFGGVQYRIHTEDYQGLKKLITTALAEIDYGESVRVENEGDTTRFHIPESKRMIELKQGESMWAQDKIYHIKFKRWIYYESKREILRFIEDALDDQDSYGVGIGRIFFHILLSMLMISVSVGITSYMVMEPRNTTSVVYDKLPEEIHLLKENRILKDKDAIMSINEELKNSFTFRSNSITEDKVQENADVALYYENKERIVYIGSNNIYLFIHDSEIGNQSTFHWVCWKIHQLYDKKSGTYYHLYGDTKEIHKILDRMMQ